MHDTSFYSTCGMFILQELHRLEEALKKEEFRKLLADYAKEIRNPENRKVQCFNILVNTVLHERTN